MLRYLRIGSEYLNVSHIVRFKVVAVPGIVKVPYPQYTEYAQYHPQYPHPFDIAFATPKSTFTVHLELTNGDNGNHRNGDGNNANATQKVASDCSEG